MVAKPKVETRGRCPLGLIGMVAIVAVVESYVGRHPLDFTETSAYSWTLSEAAARREALGAKVLCFGDSLVKHGILPEILEDRLHEPAYNLSICAAPAPGHYYLLRHALDAGARPGAIVVDFMPGLLSGTAKHAPRYWPELLTFGEILELARSSRDARFLVTAALDKLLPSKRARWEVRNQIFCAATGETDKLPPTNLTHRRNWGVHRGAQFSPDNPAFVGAVTPKEHETHLSDRFWCHRVNRLYIDRFLSLAGSRGIKVYWLLPPASPAIQEARDASGADEKHTQFVREMSSRHGNVAVLDARRSAFDHTRFVDPIHLTGRGALALSAEVAEAMAAGRVGWAALPPCRDLVPRPPLEDVEQSRMAVISAMGAARR